MRQALGAMRNAADVAHGNYGAAVAANCADVGAGPVRVAIGEQGYASATEAFVSGNLLAARTCESLADRLQGYAGMAGDDATASEFAASYDEAASESLGALADLVGGLGSLGHLAEASLRNHLSADRGFRPRLHPQLGGPRRRCAYPRRRERRMLVATPPSALGADSSSLPGWASVVLDLLEGVIWPDADTDRLRAAAGTWRAAAVSVGLLTAHCDSAVLAFEAELSPEIPLAIATTMDLRGTVALLADQLVAIGTSCEAYADQVDAKRAEMLDLLRELGIELGVGAIVAGALSLLSGGLAAGAGTAAAGSRIAVASRDLKVIVDALRVLNGSTAARLRPVSITLRDSRAYLARLAAARRTAMTERGSAMLGRPYGRDGWLGTSDAGTHLNGTSGSRMRTCWSASFSDPTIRGASTFVYWQSAERAVADVLRRKIGRSSKTARRLAPDVEAGGNDG